MQSDSVSVVQEEELEYPTDQQMIVSHPKLLPKNTNMYLKACHLA